jgi:hypothetical protein
MGVEVDSAGSFDGLPAALGEHVQSLADSVSARDPLLRGQTLDVSVLISGQEALETNESFGLSYSFVHVIIPHYQ